MVNIRKYQELGVGVVAQVVGLSALYVLTRTDHSLSYKRPASHIIIFYILYILYILLTSAFFSIKVFNYHDFLAEFKV